MKILVVGGQGMLGQELMACFPATEFTVVNYGLPELDITNEKSVHHVVDSVHPDIVINAAAFTAVDLAETEIDLAYAVNRDGPKHLGLSCRRMGVPLIHISTDYVFDGKSGRPYREQDPPSPLGIYGKSKWAGEEAIRQCHDKHIIIRTAWLYSIYGNNFVKTILRLASQQTELRVVNDQFGSPTSAKDLARAIQNICVNLGVGGTRDEWGDYHYCGAGETTWFEFARFLIEEGKEFAPLRVQRILPLSTAEYPTPAKRPQYSVLDCAKIQKVFGVLTNHWETSVRNCIKELYACPSLLPTTSS